MTGNGSGPKGPITRGLEVISGLLMILVAGCVTLQVFMRYVANAPLDWSEEVARIGLVYMTFLAGAVAVRNGRNLRIDVLVEKLPRRGRLGVGLAVHVMGLVFLVVVFWRSLPVLQVSWGTPLTGTGWPTTVFYLPVTLGALAIGAYILREAWRVLRALRHE